MQMRGSGGVYAACLNAGTMIFHFPSGQHHPRKRESIREAGCRDERHSRRLDILVRA